jgi:uncharacterized phage protein (TIGR01671 family)
MREVKFRAWDKNSGMYEVNSIGFDNCLEHTVIYGTHMGHLWTGSRGENKMTGSTVDCILMQYTGLKDKNGKEIYEGDIVKALINFGPGGDAERIFTVEITPFGVNIQEWNYKEDYLPEIIGNIYENGELLK